MTTDNRASEHDSTTNPALAVHVSQLVKRYGDMVALDYFDLDVNQGEIFGLLGPNGSGKTTAINCILALLTYDSGTIRVFGQPMTPTSYALKRRIGIVPQNVAVSTDDRHRKHRLLLLAMRAEENRPRAAGRGPSEFVGLGLPASSGPANCPAVCCDA